MYRKFIILMQKTVPKMAIRCRYDLSTDTEEETVSIKYRYQYQNTDFHSVVPALVFIIN